jgi:ankyrin repeat protein
MRQAGRRLSTSRGRSFHAVSPALAAASVRCARRLLDAGVDANAWTPLPEGEAGSKLPVLYRACESNNLGIVRLLLEHGANPNDGESIPHSAQHGHLECLDLLLAHGADISSRHADWNNTALYFLAGHADDESGQAPWLKGFRWLLEHGADPNVTSYESRETPLHQIVKQPRTLAALDALLEHGADVNFVRADGRTAYALAVRTGNSTAAERLRARGAQTDGVPAIDYLLGACARGDRDEALRLAAAQPSWTSALTKEDRGALANAVWKDNFDAVRTFVDVGFDLTWEADWGGSPLHHAAWLGKPAFVRALIDAGASINMRDCRFGSSPIAWAAHGSTNCRPADGDYIAVVDQLLDAGATWEPSINRFGEPTFNMASKRVAARLKERGFGTGGSC